jgi:hypothetical protein
MSGVIPPLPNTPSWYGAQFKKRHRNNFTFTSVPFNIYRNENSLLPFCCFSEPFSDVIYWIYDIISTAVVIQY